MAKPGEIKTAVFRGYAAKAEKRRGKGRGRGRPDRFVIDLESMTERTDPSVIERHAQGALRILRGVASELRAREQDPAARVSYPAAKVLAWTAVEARFGGANPWLVVYRVARGDEVYLAEDGEVCRGEPLSRAQAALAAIDLAVAEVVVLQRFAAWAQQMLLAKASPERLTSPPLPPPIGRGDAEKVLRAFFGREILEAYLESGRAVRDAVAAALARADEVTAALACAKAVPPAEEDAEEDTEAADFAFAAEADEGHAILRADEQRADLLAEEVESSHLDAEAEEARLLDEIAGGSD